MMRHITLALLATGLLAATLTAGDGRSLAEQKAARQALRGTHPAAPPAAVSPMTADRTVLTPAELAQKAAALEAGADALRYRELQERLDHGQPLSADDKNFYTEHTRSTVRKGGGHGVDEGGPDNFGNTWIMTGDAGGPAYFWVGIPVEDRTYLNLTDDSYTGPIDLGGEFTYYGEPYSSVYIGSNGTVAFSETAMSSLWGMVPDPNTPNNVMAMFWDDINPGAGGSMYYGYVDGAFVVTWDAVPEFGGTGTLTAQVVIEPATGFVYYNYAAFNGGIDINNCTVGIENSDGSDGLLVLSAGNPFTLSAETTIRFGMAPPADYAMRFQPRSLDLMVGSPGQVSAQVQVQNTGLLAHSLGLEANMETLDVFIRDEEGITPISTTPVLQPGETFTFTVLLEAPGDLPMMTDTGTLVAVSSGDGTELELSISVDVVATHGGPDAFGNTWTLSGDTNGTPYFWVDLPVEDRTALTLFDDTQAGPIALDGVLSFYGTARTEVYVSSNGYIGFLPTNMNMLFNTPLPDPTEWSPNSIICFFWTDLNPASGGQVYYGHDPDGRFVLTYDNVREYAGPGIITAQVVIDFVTQQVFLNYAELDDGINLMSCTVGIENDLGDDGLQVIYDSAPFLPAALTTLRFDMAPPPEYAVSIPAALEALGSHNGTYDVPLMVFNAGLQAETYTLELEDEGSEFDWSIVDAGGNVITTVGPIASLEGEEIFVRMAVPDDPAVLDEFVNLTATCVHDSERSDTCVIHGLCVPGSGTDNWGNLWTSSLAVNGPPSTWIELDEADRTYVDFPGGTFSYNGPYELPSPLAFYGGSYSEFYVSSKGNIGFIADNMAPWGVTPIPSPEAPNAQIYLFWDDLNPVAPSGGQVYYGIDGEGRLVVTFDQVRRNWDGPGWVTAQVVVDDTNNRLLLNYHEFGGDMALTMCTVGLENEDGTVAMQVLAAGNPFHPIPGLTIQVDLAPPPDYWFGMDTQVSNTGTADSEVTGTFTVYNTGTTADSYQLSVSNPDGFTLHTEINGNPASVTPTVQPGGSIDVDVVMDIPEVPPVSLTYSTLQVTSSGNGDLVRTGTMETRISLVQGGPDAGGYFWSTTDADGQVEYNWETLENPVPVTLSDDSYAGPFDLGMTWTHYGNDYTQVYISSNGYIGFGPESMNTIGGQDMPDPWVPNNIICGFQDDLNPASGGTVTCSAQDGLFIVEYNNVREFGGAGTITFQIILDADEEAARINYQAFNGLDMSFYTIGQENSDGTQGFTGSLWGQGWLPSNESSMWFGFNVIGPSGPYAVRINPDEAAGVGINGGFAEYEFEVENRGDNPSTFDLGVTGNIWDVTFHDIADDWAEITQVPNLVYDEVFALGVRVHVPAEPVSYTDQALVTVTATGHPEAVSQANILTAASCNHVDQMIANVTGTGLFGMEHLSDGEYIDNNSLTFVASGVNRMVNLNMNGTVGTISVLPAGHDYLGIAYDSRDNSYWVSYSGGISHVGSTGALIAAFSPPLLASGTGRVPMGLAFDADHNILWAICSHGGSDDFVRLDVSNAAAPVGLNAMTVPWSAPFGSGAAGLDYHEETDQMVALHTVTGASECFLDLGNGSVDARGDYCPSGLSDGHGVALTPDGDLYVGWTSGLAHPVEQYRAPCDFGVSVGGALPLPVTYELKPNYPNPFNPSTTIRYALPAAGIVRLEVYNLLGQHQATLVEGLRPAGYHEVRFDAGNLASGVYFSRVTVQDATGRETYSAVQKMMLMK